MREKVANGLFDAFKHSSGERRQRIVKELHDLEYHVDTDETGEYTLEDTREPKDQVEIIKIRIVNEGFSWL